MSTINDDDLLLVERGGVQYKLAAVDLDLSSGSIGSPVEVLTPLDGAGVGGAFNYTAKTDDIESSTAILHEGFVSTNDFTTGGADTLAMVEGHNGRIVGVAGNSGVFYTDDDGQTFTEPNHLGSGFKDICFNGSYYVAVGGTSIIYSSDGHTWSSANLPSNLQQVKSCAAAPNNGRIVICGRASSSSASPYAYSDNGGQTWSASNKSSQNSGYTHDQYVIKYGGGKFVTLEIGGAFSEYSSDGINWGYNNRGWYLQGRGIAYAEDQDKWLMVGTNSGGAIYAFASSNGASWSEEDYISSNEFREPASEHPSVLVYGHGTWIYGYSSGDGFGATNSGSTTSWSTRYVNDNTSTIYGGAFVKNKFVLWGSSPSGIYFSKDISTELYGRSPNGLFPTAKTSHTQITFASDTVFNQSGGEAVAGADFVEVFDRQLRYLGSSVNNIMSPISVSGRTITVDNDNHGYSAGPYGFVSNSSVTQYGPSPLEVEFTSQNSGTTAVSGSDATLSFRRWTLETRASSSDPWTVVTEADDYSPVASQNGAIPWAGKPTLAANTQYRIKVAYHSANAKTVESLYNTFTTGVS